METYEVLEKAIPRGEAERIARLFRLSTDEVRRWRREPEAGDNNATGRRSPLDELELLFDVLNARHPGGIDVIVDHINSLAAELRRVRGQSDSISNVQAERELRAAGRRCNEAADLLAGRGANGKKG
jgi:ankyrin repeat protein